MIAPYGAWPSPITADALVGQVVSFGAVLAGDDGAVWWSEGRPWEGGRVVIVRDRVDVLAPPFSARSRAHEYGGGAFWVERGEPVFSNDVDRRLWRGGAPITPSGAARYADGRSSVWVRQRGDVNDLYDVTTGEVVAEGRDFYAAPRPSPDGRRLAYLCWDHPNMPWDGTELWVAGEGRIAGGPDESISQPRWSPDGRLHWVSDRSGWWNLYAEPGEPLAPMDAEFAGPDWQFGQSTYTFLPDGRLVAVWARENLAHLGFVSGGGVAVVPTPFTAISSLHARGDHGVVAIAASSHAPPAVVAFDLRTGGRRVIRSSASGPVAPGEAISVARPLTFPTTGGRTAHAFFYLPRLDGYDGPPGEKPPLLLRSHGGPTSAASPALNLTIQFWTSRGFAVVDVNYGGSTGYGREYRRRLDGQWGIVDLDDCVAAAQHLAAAGEVDGDRMVVTGSSAGGYTTLCALTFRPGVFAAGTSAYGVSDLATLAANTHKFESRYLDRLVGRWPADEAVYRARSPIHHADRIRAPVLLLQGLEDQVVPPSQAEVLVEALRRTGAPFAYVTFAGEQHGFRQASTIKRAIEAELSFYGRVLGFEPAGAGAFGPVEITASGAPPS